MLAYLVVLPPETQLAIAGLVGLVVTLLFNFIGAKLPWSVEFLSKWKEEITAALAGVVTGWLANILPGGSFEQVSILGINFIVALIVALLAYGGIVFGRTVKVKSAR